MASSPAAASTRTASAGFEAGRSPRRFEAGALGGHSLRAGCVTQAAMNGVSERDIMRQTGHKSAEMLAATSGLGDLHPQRRRGLGI